MVEIEVIQFPTGTTMFKNSANDAFATLGTDGSFTFEYAPDGKKPTIVTCLPITTDLDILKNTYYKTGLIKHTSLVESDFLPIGHGGKRDGAGRPRSEETKTPYRVTDEEKEVILRLRRISKKGEVSKSALMKYLSGKLDKLEDNPLAELL